MLDVLGVISGEVVDVLESDFERDLAGLGSLDPSGELGTLSGKVHVNLIFLL